MNSTLSVVDREESLSAASHPADASGQLRPAANAADQIKAKILIVDDEADIVMSLSKRLHFAGYEIAVAGDGEEATRVALKMQPDIIILDIGMPCGDGHVVADRIRANVNTMFAQIIFLTARVGEADRDRALQAGAYGYLTKPFKPDELLRMIESALADR